MGLLDILARVNKILSVLGTVLSLLGIISGQTEKVAQENVPFTIDTNTSVTNAAVTDGTIGLAAIKTAIDTLTSNQATEFADIMTAIAALPQTTTPALLPSVFPSTWNTPLGDAVWGWPVPTRGNVAYTHLTNAGDAAEQRGFPQVIERTPFADAMWVVNGDWGQEGVSDPNPNSTFPLDISTILSSDLTSADWLNRVYSTTLWQGVFENGTLSLTDIDSANWNWTVDLPIDKWLQLKANLGLTSSGSSAPVWPGLALVTLGTSVPLTNGLVITAPMDGVIVAITSAAPGKAKYLYGTIAAYQHVGALSFTDDNSNQEAFQPLQFESQVYCAKSMVAATGVIFRVDPATTGTVIPWIAV